MNDFFNKLSLVFVLLCSFSFSACAVANDVDNLHAVNDPVIAEPFEQTPPIHNFAQEFLPEEIQLTHEPFLFFMTLCEKPKFVSGVGLDGYVVFWDLDYDDQMPDEIRTSIKETWLFMKENNTEIGIISLDMALGLQCL